MKQLWVILSRRLRSPPSIAERADDRPHTVTTTSAEELVRPFYKYTTVMSCAPGHDGARWIAHSLLETSSCSLKNELT